MAGFVTNNQIFTLTGAYFKHFQTFKQQIVISKEPIKTELTVNTTTSPVFGYQEESESSSTYTYTSVTGVFDAQVTSEMNQDTAQLEEIKNLIGHGLLRVKMQKDARDFIEDGRKTEKITYGGQTFNRYSLDAVQDFFGLVFYIYNLERTL